MKACQLQQFPFVHFPVKLENKCISSTTFSLMHDSVDLYMFTVLHA